MVAGQEKVISEGGKVATILEVPAVSVPVDVLLHPRLLS